jgi:CreA protein
MPAERLLNASCQSFSKIETKTCKPISSSLNVSCGVKGWLGLAEEVSDISLACRQIGPIRFKAKFVQGDDVFRKRRSLFFKKMQIVRGCDTKRNVLVYMVYSDRLIEGSPKNSTSSVPIMPWGQNDQIERCEDFVEK